MGTFRCLGDPTSFQASLRRAQPPDANTVDYHGPFTMSHHDEPSITMASMAITEELRCQGTVRCKRELISELLPTFDLEAFTGRSHQFPNLSINLPISSHWPAQEDHLRQCRRWHGMKPQHLASPAPTARVKFRSQRVHQASQMHGGNLSG